MVGRSLVLAEFFCVFLRRAFGGPFQLCWFHKTVVVAIVVLLSLGVVCGRLTFDGEHFIVATRFCQLSTDVPGVFCCRTGELSSCRRTVVVF